MMVDDVVGELLRSKFFKGNGHNFKPQDDVEVTSEDWMGVIQFFGKKIVGNELVHANWSWTNGWYLEFLLENGTTYFNRDAKKDYGWGKASWK